MATCSYPGCENPATYNLSVYATEHVDSTFKGTKEEKAARHTPEWTKPVCSQHYLVMFQKELLHDEVKCIHLANPEAKEPVETEETFTS